jgi:hypothetical protein
MNFAISTDYGKQKFNNLQGSNSLILLVEHIAVIIKIKSGRYIMQNLFIFFVKRYTLEVKAGLFCFLGNYVLSYKTRTIGCAGFTLVTMLVWA